MPLIASTYRSPRWLIGGHAQTIVPPMLLPSPAVDYRRERWTAPDGDFLDVDFALPEPADAAAPILVLFHGLEGSSRSRYALTTMRLFADRGWRAMVVHFRGCSGEPNVLPRAYHSGDSEEGDWVLRRVHGRWPQAKLHAAGVSLGGNMLAKWLGERAEDASFVTAAASIGSPLDLSAGGAALSRGFNMLYTRMFMTTLRAKTLTKIERFPDHFQGHSYGATLGERVRVARDLYEYDNAYTAPVHGFRDTEDYWLRASGKPWLSSVKVPHLVLNARNDPFVPVASLPTARDVSDHVVLEQPDSGGHIGFAGGSPQHGVHFIAGRLHEFFTRG